MSFAWHYHNFLQHPFHLLLIQSQPCKHSLSCLPAFHYSMYLYERDLKFQEKQKYLVKAVLHEHRKNHLPCKSPSAIQHFQVICPDLPTMPSFRQFITACQLHLENKRFHTNHKSSCKEKKNPNMSAIMVEYRTGWT